MRICTAVIPTSFALASAVPEKPGVLARPWAEDAPDAEPLDEHAASSMAPASRTASVAWRRRRLLSLRRRVRAAAWPSPGVIFLDIADTLFTATLRPAEIVQRGLRANRLIVTSGPGGLK